MELTLQQDGENMKNLKEIKKRIMENKKTLIETYGIKEIGIFGSFSRNEQNEFSDIDILVSLKNDYKTFDNYMNLKEFLESILNIKVDLVTVDALKPRLKKLILKETIYV